MLNSTIFVLELLDITVSSDTLVHCVEFFIGSLATYSISRFTSFKRLVIETVKSRRKTDEFIKRIKNLDDIIQAIKNLFRRK